MKEFDWNKEDWDKQVVLFKAQGCALFQVYRKERR